MFLRRRKKKFDPAGPKRRQQYRVALSDDPTVRLSLVRSDGSEVRTQLLDLTVRGVRFRTCEEGLDLHVDEIFQAVVTADMGWVVQTPAMVRRHQPTGEGNEWGMEFINAGNLFGQWENCLGHYFNRRSNVRLCPDEDLPLGGWLSSRGNKMYGTVYDLSVAGAGILVSHIEAVALELDEDARVGFRLPYGFPGRFPMQILALPAWGDEGTVELWAGLMEGQAPVGEPAPQRGGPEEAASLRVTDLLGQLEATRVLLESAGLAGTELWSTEVLAHSVLLSAWQRDESADADRMQRLAVTLRPPGAPALALDGYRPGVAMRDWLVFQAAFQQGARSLARKPGPKAGRALIKMARKNGGRLSGEALLRRFPELAAWHRATFAATAAR